ncbi:putative ribonuclease H protein [Citrus sinensis]|nr:putative ribonuclease H protein [Citrus sinensis]
MPLLHSRVTTTTYQEIVDKVEKRMSTWNTSHLSLAGRITLAQSILQAIPIYAMQTTCLPSRVKNKADQACRQFIWNGTTTGRKLSQVGWNTICKQKISGGLGFKNLEIMNQALLMKIYWGLISSTESLWIKVLHTKYGIINLKLQADLPNTNCSSLWRSVSKLLNKTIMGAGWSIDNGEKARFWWDCWATKARPLIDYAIAVLPQFMKTSCMGPQAIRVFIWTVLHDRLKIKRELMRRHLVSNGYCDRCGLDLESTLHVLRDCPMAKRVWNHFVPRSLQADFYSKPLKKWIIYNVQSKEQYRWNLDWNCIFEFTIWRLWYWRNKFRFDHVYVDSKFVTQDIMTWAEENQRANDSLLGTAAKKKEAWLHWSPPIWPWCKLNSDGSSKRFGLSSAGGIIRDYSGKWIRGFGLNIGCCSITNLELWGLYQGLLIAWEIGIRWILLEVDSLCVTQFVASSSSPVNDCSQLVLPIQDLLKREWHVEIKHIYR